MYSVLRSVLAMVLELFWKNSIYLSVNPSHQIMRGDAMMIEGAIEIPRCRAKEVLEYKIYIVQVYEFVQREKRWVWYSRSWNWGCFE